MANLAKALTGLAALAFVMAVAANYTGVQLRATAEGYSSAAQSLALLAIAVTLVFGAGRSASTR